MADTGAEAGTPTPTSTEAEAGAADGSRSRREAMVRIATIRLESRIPVLVGALDAAGVPSIVLKGPATRQRLYAADEPRPMGDIDLLVPGRRRRRAERVLTGEGFTQERTVGHADTWRGPKGVVVDLHATLPYAGRSPGAVWRALQAHVVQLDVRGEAVPVLDEASHFVHLAIHAVQNGVGSGDRSLAELRRAVARFAPEVQADAAVLAAHLGVGAVVDVALLALDDPIAAAQAEQALPARVPIGLDLRAFLTSPLSWQERWRASREPFKRFLGDEKVATWLARRGRPMPITRWGIRRAKAERIVVVAGRELADLVRRRPAGRPAGPPSGPPPGPPTT